MALDSTRVINGTYGQVFQDGEWLTNVTSIEANVELNKEEIPRSGTRWPGRKVTGLSGTGSIGGYKVTSDFIDKIGQIAEDDGQSFVTELIVKLADPDSWGTERIRLKNVQFDSIPLVNFEVGSIVEENLDFTFEKYELMDKISK